MTGILGGVFDPPHCGHVALARAAVRQLHLDRLLVLVVADPGHKEAIAPAEARLELARLAFAEIPVAAVELDPHSRTVESLETLGLKEPIFVLGSDELADFGSWTRPERVLELARLAVVRRPGTSDGELHDAVAALPVPDRVAFFELQPQPISSTGIRARVARGEDIAGLVPATVAAEIARLGLYQDSE